MVGDRTRPYRPPQSRLKPVQLDLLEDIGLPSKGDDRLLNLETQEIYYTNIEERYHVLYKRSGQHNSMDESFAYLSLHGASDELLSTTEGATARTKDSNGMFEKSSRESRELSTIIMAMRKIREAIVATGRKDKFAARVYIFIIRATILERHVESYQPALLHLLQKIHPVAPLTADELNEFIGYYVLDLACRQGDMAAAYQIKFIYMLDEKVIDLILKALIHGRWSTFWRIEESMTLHQKRLVGLAVPGVRQHALRCIGKSYLSLDKDTLEVATQRQWRKLKQEDQVEWTLDGEVVIIRKLQKK